jgi:hypothetical protein
LKHTDWSFLVADEWSAAFCVTSIQEFVCDRLGEPDQGLIGFPFGFFAILDEFGVGSVNRV